jgi:transcriptional regulator GlxA family with amidase domain
VLGAPSWISSGRKVPGREPLTRPRSAETTYMNKPPQIPGFRLGIYVFKDAEVIDYAAPYGVFSVARRFDPELDAFLIAESMRPTQTQAGFTVLPNYAFNDRPSMNAFLIPGGFGTRQETNNARLQEFIRALPGTTILASVCTGSWVYGRMGLLDGLPATNRKEPDRLEGSQFGKVPIDRLAEIAPRCRISRARVVDAGRIITAGGISSGMELGFHLLRRAGYDEAFIHEVSRVMEYHQAYASYRGDIEYAPAGEEGRPAYA